MTKDHHDFDRHYCTPVAARQCLVDDLTDRTAGLLATSQSANQQQTSHQLASHLVVTGRKTAS